MPVRNETDQGEKRKLTAANQNLVGSVFIPQLGGVAFPRFLKIALERENRNAVENKQTYKLDCHMLVV